MRIDLGGDPSFSVALERVRETALAAFDHELFPFPELVKHLHPDRDTSRSPLFQLFFAFQKAQVSDGPSIGPFALGLPGGRMKLGKLAVQSMPARRSGSQFDLSFLLAEVNEGLGGVVEYNSDLFDEATIDRAAAHFKALLASIVASPDRCISSLQIMSRAEIEQVLVDWNRTEADCSGYDNLVTAIDAQAWRAPDAIAVASGADQITTRELNRRADKVAGRLIAEGIGADMIVGVLMERAPEMVIALLGVLKSGAAFLPLDPAFPAERILFMASTAGAQTILTKQRSARLVEEKGLCVVCLDPASAWTGDAERINPPAIVPVNLAYVIYTSGSTGEPKGAMNTHGAILNRLLWMEREYLLDGSDCVLQKTPFIFDVSVWEFFWPLMTGAKLVMA